MNDSAATRPSLLLRLRDRHDTDAWQQFVRLYAPLVYQFGRRKGLQDADAADLTQEVLRSVGVGAGRLEYDPRRGSFRGWLFTIAHRRLCDLLRRRRRQEQGSGDSAVQGRLDEQPAPEDEAAWEREYQQRLFAWAAEQVRSQVHETTWQAFWQTAVTGDSGQEVAQRLGLSVAAVYLARSRVMTRLKEQIRQAEAQE
jgi:RNA polymerase sigma-70 factor (ECF subfamily)